MFSKNTHIHFMGISGIGMSGIAKILLQQGYKVSGCDLSSDPKHIAELISLGCVIAPTHLHKICNDPTISILVHSTAVNKEHPEFLAAKLRNIILIHRATMLAEIMRIKFSIAVAGSHGKTTTTSLLTHVLLEAQQNPTFIIGGHLNSLKTNAENGSGPLCIAEADESDRSFLVLPKAWSIVTNIDLEHLETYKDFDDVKQTFLQFIHQIPFYGFNILCIDDAGIRSIISEITTPFISYGQHPNAQIRIENVQLSDDSSQFTLFNTKSQRLLGTFTTNLPGVHNILNTTAIITMALQLEIPLEIIRNAVATFTGVDRRFTFKGIWQERQSAIFDDYGHHPEEIRNTLLVARKKAKKNLIVIFQPHRFTRTKHLWHDFINVLSDKKIDQLILTDIYPANEQPITGITTHNLITAIRKQNPNIAVWYYPCDDNGTSIVRHLQQHSHNGDLILFQGAGKINKIAQSICSNNTIL